MKKTSMKGFDFNKINIYCFIMKVVKQIEPSFASPVHIITPSKRQCYYEKRFWKGYRDFQESLDNTLEIAELGENVAKQIKSA